MRKAAAVGATVLAVTLAGIGATGTASADSSRVTSCSTKKISSQVAEGWCSSGETWRLGIRCSDASYQWTTWYNDSRTVRLACLSGKTLTHYWIDN